MDFTITYRARRILKAYEGKIQSGMKVLDVGCGNGIVGGMIASHFKCRLTGADILSYVKTGIPFVQLADGGKLPFGDGEFDIVMLNDMLHHVPHDGQVSLIKEALRVGRKVLVFEVKPTWYVKFTDWLPNKVHQPLMRISLSHRTREGWEALFKDLGVQVKTVELSDPQISGNLTAPERLAQLLYRPVVNFAFST